jgi:hypothetical protein
MRDVNDMWVNDNCKTVIHCRGYAFTISELMDISIRNCSEDKLEAHKDVE